MAFKLAGLACMFPAFLPLLGDHNGVGWYQWVLMVNSIAVGFWRSRYRCDAHAIVLRTPTNDLGWVEPTR